MQKFHYAPLDLQTRSFRLLRLLSGSDNEEIECEIFEAVFQDEDLIPYEALSYAWGSPDTPHRIKLNHKYLAITENLHVALHHLRSEVEDRIMWIDAICIDQGNALERGHQVKQMGSIYSRAEQVIFWLGPAARDTDFTMSALKRVERLSQEKSSSSWLLSDREWLRSWAMSQTDWHDLAIKQCRGLDELLNRPWFSRTWVLQEVANAKRAVVCVGNMVVSSKILPLALAIFDMDPWEQDRATLKFQGTPAWVGVSVGKHCQPVLEIMPGPLRDRSWWGEQRDLFTLLQKFHMSQASDPRDKIYALLGIASDVSGDSALRPDYTKSIEQLILDVTAFIFPGLPPSPLCFWDMGSFLSNLPRLPRLYYYWILKTGKVEDVVTFLMNTRLVSNIERADPQSLVMAATNEVHGAEIMETLLSPGAIRQREAGITGAAIAAAVMNIVSGPRILQMLYQHGNYKIKSDVFGTVVEAADLGLGCGKEVFAVFKSEGLLPFWRLNEHRIPLPEYIKSVQRLLRAFSEGVVFHELLLE